MRNEKAVILLKCLLIVFIMVVPNLFSSAYALQNNYQDLLAFELNGYSALSWLIMAVQVSFPVLLLIFISGESFAFYGFTKIKLKEFIFSLLRLVALFLVFLFIIGLISNVIESISGKEADADVMENQFKIGGSNVVMILLNIVPIILMAFTEELCFRSYLFLNLRKIIKNEWVCIIICNVLFSIYHIYQGIASTILVFFIGLVFSMEFRKHKNIYTITTIHAFWNIIMFSLY
ncbi:CPBP family intramembrane glutamic endopeptidase [Breznakiella homolactica]|uniref:CPBP family intramembrane metalloprotease n=1 Tax=Breznakiella homolactica TaxID=2798577 RepID=A0A7T8BBI6_9SPIR|nr:type II CAAX endopeptidase family protein [Breznakiella homolactica]QQO10607.1 CPBP family intramembrane metalloprotease [Breznakiella homolactica]